MINITKLTHSIANSNTSLELQKLYSAGGEINEDPCGVFKLQPHEEGLLVKTKSPTECFVYMGMFWTNYEDVDDGILEIADVELVYNTVTNTLTSMQSCGTSTPYPTLNFRN